VRVLIVRLSALGDVVMGLHVLSTLRARLGSAHVGWLVEDRFSSVLDGHPQIDSLHVYPRKEMVYRRNKMPRPSGLAAFGRLIRELRAAEYDVVLDLQANLKSGALSWLSGGRRRLSPAPPLSKEGNSFFMTESIPSMGVHRMNAYRGLIDAIAPPQGTDGPPNFGAVLHSEAPAHGCILLHPGVSGFGSFKRWPVEAFGELATRLSQSLDRPIMLTAGPGERDQVLRVADAAGGAATIVEPGSLRELVDTLAGAHLVIAADTGPAHIAAATGVPTLTLFGPKDPAVLSPLGPRTATVRAGVRCSPCTLRACPDPICMSQLTVDQVEQSAHALLDEANA
jgi:ADP-heptose:LPS heptosyltransferase